MSTDSSVMDEEEVETEEGQDDQEDQPEPEAKKASKKAPKKAAPKAKPAKSKAPAVDLFDGATKQTLRLVASSFKLLADVTRLKLLACSTGEHTVGDMVKITGQTSQPAVSHHLALLKASGLCYPVRAGKENNYVLTKRGRAMLRIIKPVIEACTSEEDD